MQYKYIDHLGIRLHLGSANVIWSFVDRFCYWVSELMNWSRIFQSYSAEFTNETVSPIRNGDFPIKGILVNSGV